MKFHEILRQRRLALGLTQEQLAQRLGVSAPAVNKWERNNSYPDITLLPPLARLLEVDLNTLLSFQEELTEEEIGAFANVLGERAQQEGCVAAFRLARDKLREFPNSDLLAYSLAGLLEGLVLMSPDAGEQGDRDTWTEEIDALYERGAASADPKVREWACTTLAGKCIGRGNLDRAQSLLAQLSDTHREKRTLTAALRKKEGRTGEAWELLERELMEQALSIQTTLLHLLDLALEEEDQGRARILSDTACQAGAILGLMDYAALSAPFQLAAAEQDGPKALELLDRLLRSLTVPWDLSASPLYPHLPTKDAAEESQRSLIPVLLDGTARDPDCAFLRAEPGWPELLARYQT